MKVPRNLGGERLAVKLGKYGYEVTRTTGSHMRLSSSIKGHQHHVTVPRHSPLKVGTLSGILKDVATYLQISVEELAEDL